MVTPPQTTRDIRGRGSEEGGPWTGDQKGSRVVRGKWFVGKNFAKNFGGRGSGLRGGWAGRDPRPLRGVGGLFVKLVFLMPYKNIKRN